MANAFWPGWQTGALLRRETDGTVYEIQKQSDGKIEKAALKVIPIPRDAGLVEQLRKEGYTDEGIAWELDKQADDLAAEYLQGRKADVGKVSRSDVHYLRNQNGIGGNLLIKMELPPSAGERKKEREKKKLTIWTVVVAAVVAVALLATIALKFSGKSDVLQEDQQTAMTMPAETEQHYPDQEETKSEEQSEMPTIQYWHPLTGEILEKPFSDRIIAFNIDNVSGAMPQHGISQADVICEMIVEGSATRTIALFSQTTSANAIGPLRGARPQLVSLAKAYDAVFTHLGGSDHVRALYNTGMIDYIDNVPSVIYKDSGRLSQGYSREHSYFASGEKISSYVKENFDISGSEQYFWDFDFYAEPVLEPEVTELSVCFGLPGAKTTLFQYNKTLGGYTAEQHGKTYIDGNTGETVVFQNVLVLLTSPDAAGEKTIVGQNNGWCVSNGRMIPIVWSRKDEFSEFSFSCADGTALTITPGKSYIAIIPSNGNVEWQ